GVARYRKVETRLIVSRPSKRKDDGTLEQTALFGSYAWNENETEAELVTDPLRSGDPSADRIFTLLVDEPGAQKVRDSLKDQPGSNVDYYLWQAKVVRHYAIPGSERCEQCHMGSIDQSFVLGFAPLQIARRRHGEGGTLVESGPDELTQLERL